jgi:hypothetical protein
MPDLAGAQDFGQAVDNSSATVFNPFIRIVDFISYAIGTVLVVSGILGAKKHAERPTDEPLGKAIGKLAAGGAFLILPSIAGMLQDTVGNTTGHPTTSFNPLGGVD